MKSQLIVHDPEPESESMPLWHQIQCAACVVALIALWMLISWGLMPL